MPSTSPSASPESEAPPAATRRWWPAVWLVWLVGLGVLVVTGAFLLRSGGGGDDALLNAASGGEGTVDLGTRNAFGTSARNLTNLERRDFEVGDSFFTQNWVTAPASTEARDGLGPLSNAQACASCHVLDGRAEPPTGDAEGTPGLLMRTSVPDEEPWSGPQADPVYGDQIQDRAVLGVDPEAAVTVDYEETAGSYPDGTPFSLRTPTYTLTDPAYGPLDPDLMMSPRIAPPVFGSGLLEAIPENAVLESADDDDTDGDGVSGRPNYVYDVGAESPVLGRFGWKANVPTVRQQAAAAFNGDLGITSSLFPDETCTEVQVACVAAPSGGSPEIDDERLDKVTFYTSTLAVPVRRNLDDPDVVAGAELFAEVGCEVCHRAAFTTGDHPVAALADQEIRPFTDLLLHDMGPGLADGRPDFLASRSEWRTPPLWGIGLTETVNNHTTFLHDGRARSLEEAILWHGGEAEAARTDFTELAADDRSRIIAFLESL